jgi:hypothetical protein
MLTVWTTFVFIGFMIPMAINIYQINKIHSTLNYNYSQDLEDKKRIKKKARTIIFLFVSMIAVIFFTDLFHYLITKKAN